MTTLLKGVDVGDAQGSVDWKKVRTAGYVFAWLKGTEGGNFVAKTFTVERVKAVRAAGLIWGPYHYLRPRTDRNGATEAKFAVETALARGWKPGYAGIWRGRDLPMCVDIERGGNEAMLARMTGAQLWEYASDFCDEVKRQLQAAFKAEHPNLAKLGVQKLTGRGCVGYLSPGFAPELGNRAPRNCGASWVAAWDAPDGRPPMPAGFSSRYLYFHQTANNGHVPGIGAPVDLNVFVGSLTKLRSLVAGRTLGQIPKPPTPVAPKPRMATKDVQRALHDLGWPLKADGVRGPQTVAAIKAFQRGVANGPRLVQDGLVGPATAAALAWSAANDGRVSPHFRWREFGDKTTGWIMTHRALVLGLEKLRERIGPVVILSAYRDPSRNIGASLSQHKYGNAVDPNQTWPSANEVAKLGVFSGIGYDPRHGSANTAPCRHVDVRHVGPNTTGGTPAHPTVFTDTF